MEKLKWQDNVFNSMMQTGAIAPETKVQKMQRRTRAGHTEKATRVYKTLKIIVNFRSSNTFMMVRRKLIMN